MLSINLKARLENKTFWVSLVSAVVLLIQQRGLDASKIIPFNKAKTAGIEAVYIKATEGTAYTDSYLDTNYSNAHYAGLKTGFYHFLVGNSTPET